MRGVALDGCSGVVDTLTGTSDSAAPSARGDCCERPGESNRLSFRVDPCRRYRRRVDYLAIAVAIVIASVVIAVAGGVVSITAFRHRRLLSATGSDMPTDFGLVALMIGLAGLISGLGVVVFLLLTT